jgi:hypothetical protein
LLDGPRPLNRQQSPCHSSMNRWELQLLRSTASVQASCQFLVRKTGIVDQVTRNHPNLLTRVESSTSFNGDSADCIEGTKIRTGIVGFAACVAVTSMGQKSLGDNVSKLMLEFKAPTYVKSGASRHRSIRSQVPQPVRANRTLNARSAARQQKLWKF